MSNAITTTDKGLALASPQPLDQSPALVYLAGLHKRSVRSQRKALQVIAEDLTGSPDILALDWSAIRFQHSAAIRAKLGEKYAPATVNRFLAALRGTLKAAFLLGQMPAEDYQRAVMVENLTHHPLPAGRHLTHGEISALMETCEADPTPAGPRDAACIACLYPGGLRRSEIPALDLADYEPETGALTVRQSKGRKDRIAYLDNGGRRAMDDWLSLRRLDPGALFWPVNKAGKLVPHRMTPQAIYLALGKRGKEAGVANFSPHDLRRTFVSDLLDAGADIATVAALAGHANVTTTQRYDRRPEQAKQKAAGLLHLPYTGRKAR